MPSTSTPIKIDQLIRSKRKTIALIVKADGSLVVRAPLRVREELIRSFVEEKADWIRARQAEFAALELAHPRAVEHKFMNGESFLFLGESYPLQIVEKARPALQLNGTFTLAKASVPRARQVFTAWYKAQALRIFTERCAWYAAKYGFSYKKIRISSARTRWGSCSTTGTLSFTWRLAMAPPAVIDCVVVHELVHTLEKNHGKQYWARVKAIQPDYKTFNAWLKTHGQTLMI